MSERDEMRERVWRPWDTCPQDGRTVLARFDDLYCETVCRTPDGWYWYEDGDTSGTRSPTHWMPIPALIDIDRDDCPTCRKLIGATLAKLDEGPEPVGQISPTGLERLRDRGLPTVVHPVGDRRMADGIKLYASPVASAPESKQSLPYPEDGGRTHFEGCWRERGHHNCAVTEIERLRALAESHAGEER